MENPIFSALSSSSGADAASATSNLTLAFPQLLDMAFHVKNVSACRLDALFQMTGCVNRGLTQPQQAWAGRLANAPHDHRFTVRIRRGASSARYSTTTRQTIIAEED